MSIEDRIVGFGKREALMIPGQISNNWEGIEGLFQIQQIFPNIKKNCRFQFRLKGLNHDMNPLIKLPTFFHGYFKNNTDMYGPPNVPQIFCSLPTMLSIQLFDLLGY